MKIHVFLAITCAAFLGALAGCQTQSAAVATNDNPAKKVYTQADLDASGRAQTGPALQQIDPDISRQH
ncbi:MAG: hypothetical protein ACREIF_03445 [Chthoniobacterales bacterium]